MDQATQRELLEAAGFSTKIWNDRLYVRKDGTDYGYLTESDDGGTGTCSRITKRAGTIAEILRTGAQS